MYLELILRWPITVSVQVEQVGLIRQFRFCPVCSRLCQNDSSSGVWMPQWMSAICTAMTRNKKVEKEKTRNKGPQRRADCTHLRWSDNKDGKLLYVFEHFGIQMKRITFYFKKATIWKQCKRWHFDHSPCSFHGGVWVHRDGKIRITVIMCPWSYKRQTEPQSHLTTLIPPVFLDGIRTSVQRSHHR